MQNTIKQPTNIDALVDHVIFYNCQTLNQLIEYANLCLLSYLRRILNKLKDYAN